MMNYVLNNLIIQTKIFVNQLVTHSGGRAPWNTRVTLAKVDGYAFDRLSITSRLLTHARFADSSARNKSSLKQAT